MSSEENYRAVRAGRSALTLHAGLGLRQDDIVLSRFDRHIIDEECAREGVDIVRYTFFERICILSAKHAIEAAAIEPSSPRVIFIISTTKANVSMLSGTYLQLPEDRILPGVAANAVAGFFRNPNPALTVCNACISGVSAQIEALRCLRSGRYDTAVVVGADEQSEFIYSGFLSFKALSPEPCRPFDKSRCGLNPGEAAATVILQAKARASEGDWELVDGASRNDANHISGPSRTGEGSLLVLNEMLRHCTADELSFLNVHGTATLYNDEMESIAIDRAGLSELPVTGLKGYYGHTMGAAGLLESILSMKAVEDSCVLATKGFHELGVSRPVNVSPENRSTDGSAFIKLISGFGGSNAAVLYRMHKNISL